MFCNILVRDIGVWSGTSWGFLYWNLCGQPASCYEGPEYKIEGNKIESYKIENNKIERNKIQGNKIERSNTEGNKTEGNKATGCDWNP